MVFRNARQRKAAMARMSMEKVKNSKGHIDWEQRRPGTMTGKSVTRVDKQIVALKPGKRITSHGSVYYEYRRNRSDKSRTARL